jgi:hypothetical protein
MRLSKGRGFQDGDLDFETRLARHRLDHLRDARVERIGADQQIDGRAPAVLADERLGARKIARRHRKGCGVVRRPGCLRLAARNERAVESDLIDDPAIE